MNTNVCFTTIYHPLRDNVDVFKIITSFLSPADNFSLALTDRSFHLSDGRFFPEGGLGRNLIRSSLFQGLASILSSNLGPQAIDSFILLAQRLPEGSIAISGSTIVQCLLGKRWISDIDIYCTPEVAPQVRTWLTRDCGLISRTLITILPQASFAET